MSWFITKRLSVFAFIALCFAAIDASAGDYVAYSLRTAQNQAQAGLRSKDLVRLGGMTRILGMVHDSAGDIVLVGRRIPGQPAATLDDLVIALRARLLLDRWPTVSIDPVAGPDGTSASGLQRVNFDGGIANTAFGRDFLQSDIWLKRYSFNLEPIRKGIPSFRALTAVQVTGGGDSAEKVEWQRVDPTQRTPKGLTGRALKGRWLAQARFWFTPDNPHLIIRDGVFSIERLRLKVAVERLSPETADANPTRPGDPAKEPATLFADALTEHMAVLKDIPSIARLKVLFDLTMVAEGIRSLVQRPGLDWLLARYPVTVEPTGEDFERIRLIGRLELADGTTGLISLSGGVRFSSELRLLNYGDVTPLRRIVLETRPEPDALTWELPLSGWHMPNSDDLPVPLRAPEKEPASSRPGFSLAAETLFLAPPDEPAARESRRFAGFTDPAPVPPLAMTHRLGLPDRLGGVTMQLELRPSAFRRDQSLDALRESLLRGGDEDPGMIRRIPIQ